MTNLHINSTDLRLLLPEVILLEAENFYQAKEMSKQAISEAQQWQSYLNHLAFIGFEKWSTERMPKQVIHRSSNTTDTVTHLNLGDFKVCLISTEHLLDEVVNVPQSTIFTSEFSAHFYVLAEVLEEQEQVIIKGFLRYDQLIDYCTQVNSPPLQECYQIPLSLFDTEPNHLLFYSDLLTPSSIPLPSGMSQTKTTDQLIGYVKKTTTKLSQWLEGLFEEGWLALDALINAQDNFALSTRNTEVGIRRAKLIDLGMQLRNQTFALLVNITEASDDKLSLLIQLHPTSGERFLPPNLKLNLLSKAGKTLQEVQSRSQDNYIQLKPFKGEQGKRFRIEISLEDVQLGEDFEL
ncbi:MAG: DUF1822 family protein [Rhizonema sp. NSF051]|nr:DUF1822 family protein [Rhizonema sp. NSF051]